MKGEKINCLTRKEVGRKEGRKKSSDVILREKGSKVVVVVVHDFTTTVTLGFAKPVLLIWERLPHQIESPLNNLSYISLLTTVPRVANKTSPKGEVRWDQNLT